MASSVSRRSSASREAWGGGLGRYLCPLELLERFRVARLRGPARKALGILAQGERGLVGRLAPQIETLERASQPVERGSRRLVAANGLLELVLRGSPLLQQPLEAGVSSTLLCIGRRTTLLDRLEALVEPREGREIESLAQPVDVLSELLGSLRCGCLQAKRSKPLLHLVFEIACPLDVVLNPSELEPSSMPALLEGAEASGFLDERTSVGRLRREHCIDLALRNDRVHLAPEPNLSEHVKDIEAANRRAVDQVLNPPRRGEAGV